MTVRNFCLALLFGLAVVACGGNGGSAATVGSGSAVTSSAAADATPIQAGVDYTQLADFSGYDNWVCDNATILDPNSGAVLTPDVSISENPGALQRSVSSNSIPDHRVGDFPNVGNPNEIDEVSVNYDVVMRVATEDPAKASVNPAQLVGISVGGILFDPNTAEVYNNDRSSGWNYEALTIGASSNGSLAGAIGYLGTDCNNAHVQPNGKYHYHGMPEELVSNLLEAAGNNLADPDMVMVGYAADGYPMYARYGYTNPLDPTSGALAM